jgi:hypothetical protein
MSEVELEVVRAEVTCQEFEKRAQKFSQMMSSRFLRVNIFSCTIGSECFS